ncbi:MAG: formyltransferase family protein [Salinirussus sp.]
MNLAGIAGGRGRALLHLADRAPGSTDLSVVLTTDPDAPVLSAARDRDVPTAVVEPGGDRDDHETRLLDALEDRGIDLVALDGYPRELSPAFLDAAPTTLAAHPSLLPAFPGPDAPAAALDAGVSVTGSTVHLVTATDSTEPADPPIVTQEPVPVHSDDDSGTLADRIRHQGTFRAYPRAVRWFATDRATVHGGALTVDEDGGSSDLPERRLIGEDRAAELRYGENPHQTAALYADRAATGASVVGADRRNPGAKALSYNNYNDADAALGLVREFDDPATAIVKHANPVGCATADTVATAYDRALSTDPMSAFGGIVACNRPCDAATADRIVESFKEVVVAPTYTDDALAILRGEADLRVLAVGTLDPGSGSRTVESHLAGGRLVQAADDWQVTPGELTTVTDREPTDAHRRTMRFAWNVVKHVASNAVLLATRTETVGVGMGQASRVDAVRLAVTKAREHAEGKGPAGAVLASDAFFPFPDGLERAAEAGVDAVVQPGGSTNDDQVIAAAEDHGVAMAFTGHRAFRHG